MQTGWRHTSKAWSTTDMKWLEEALGRGFEMGIK
jgi:hypothetical protein